MNRSGMPGEMRVLHPFVHRITPGLVVRPTRIESPVRLDNRAVVHNSGTPLASDLTEVAMEPGKGQSLVRTAPDVCRRCPDCRHDPSAQPLHQHWPRTSRWTLAAGSAKLLAQI